MLRHRNTRPIRVPAAIITREQAATKLGLRSWEELESLVESRLLLAFGPWPNSTFNSGNVDDLIEQATRAQAAGRDHPLLTLQRNPTQEVDSPGD